MLSEYYQSSGTWQEFEQKQSHRIYGTILEGLLRNSFITLFVTNETLKLFIFGRQKSRTAS